MQALPNVNVYAKKSGRGTVSDIRGAFVLDARVSKPLGRVILLKDLFRVFQNTKKRKRSSERFRKIIIVREIMSAL